MFLFLFFGVVFGRNRQRGLEGRKVSASSSFLCSAKKRFLGYLSQQGFFGCAKGRVH